MLAGGDLFTYFYPYWAEASRALRAGRLPLWNPYLFMGVPFVANSQVGFFYPPNWLLWLLLAPHRSLHWSIVLHLMFTATGAYTYGRASLRLGRLAAWIVGVAWALGGYLGAQVEHINQLQALSWFPWLLLVYDLAALEAERADGRSGRRAMPLLRSLRLGSYWWIVLGAGVGMVLLAGHTQSAFIVVVGLALYGIGPAAWRAVRRGERGLLVGRTLLLAVAALLGIGLAMVQLMPTFQLTQLSVRAGGLPFKERVSFSLSPLYLARALLPGYVRPVEPENVEYVATIGVCGLLLAVTALYAGPRRRHPAVAGVLWLMGAGLFLALGLYNPVYLLLARFVPGFAHFRAPARWLALWAFGAAALAGVGSDRVVDDENKLGGKPWLIRLFVGLAALLAWGALGGRVALPTVGAWVGAAVLAVAAAHLRKRALLAALLVAELVLSARTLPRARATAPQAYTSLRPAVAHLLAANEGRTPPDRFLSLSGLTFDPGDLPELRSIYGERLSSNALYDLIVAAKHREVLSPNLPLALRVPAVDGYDGGVLPLARFLALQRAFLAEDEVSLDGRLRENLAEVPDGRWLSVFNVRYVITDKVFDAWIDGVFYDLQFGASLGDGEAAAVAYIPSFEATAVGLVTHLNGAASLADGALVGEVRVQMVDGTEYTFPLRAGEETAEGIYGPDVAHQQAPVGGHFWPGEPEGTDYVVRLRWERPSVPADISVRGVLATGELVVRGISLIDERTGAFQSLVLSDQGNFRLVHSGDVKVYENLDVLPRAFVVHRAHSVAGEQEALAQMRASGFDPTKEVVVEGGTALDAQPVGEEGVRVLSYEPERVELEVDMTAPGYLILTDANYPGWEVWVDGRPAAVHTADLLFRAVYLDAGRHRVLFSFQPTPMRWGAVATALSLGALGVGAFCVYNGGKGRRSSGSPLRRTTCRRGSGLR